MDPNAALTTVRELVNETRTVADDPYSTIDPETVRSLLDHFDALDEWIVKGGFLPADWNRQPTTMNRYAVRVRHDSGTIVIHTSAPSDNAAIDQVMKAEGCPLRSILSVRRMVGGKNG